MMSMQSAGTDGEAYSLSDFERLSSEDAHRYELVRGRLVREPRPAPLHARVLMRIAYRLEQYAESTGRGAVLPDAGFVLAERPPTVRGPDVAFVSRERLPENAYEEPGFWHLAPDLAVEVVSPSNAESELREKAFEYLNAGTRVVWLADPSTRTITVYRSRRDVRVLEAHDELDGGDVLPGFRAPTAELIRP